LLLAAEAEAEAGQPEMAEMAVLALLFFCIPFRRLKLAEVMAFSWGKKWNLI
jgi:hypothetical protein